VGFAVGPIRQPPTHFWPFLCIGLQHSGLTAKVRTAIPQLIPSWTMIQALWGIRNRCAWLSEQRLILPPTCGVPVAGYWGLIGGVISTRAAPTRRRPRSPAAPNAVLRMKNAANTHVPHRIVVFICISLSSSYALKTERRASPSGFIRNSHLLSKIIKAPSLAVNADHFARIG